MLVVGLGSIGGRHLDNLRTLRPDAEIAVLCRSGRTDRPRGSFQVLNSLEAALEFQPHGSIIASPAPDHVPVSTALAEAGSHLMVEKPIAAALDGVAALIDVCRTRGVSLLVGYTYRFHPVLRAMHKAVSDGMVGRVLSIRAEVGQYLPDWRPGVDYRTGVSAREELGGGVLLELSHEIDYVRWIGGEVNRVFAETGQLSDLEIDVEDVAELVLRFASGAIGSVHLDMVQRAATRTCRVIGTTGTLVWDRALPQLAWYSAGGAVWSRLGEPRVIDPNAMYMEELRHFLASMDGTEQPLVSGEEGKRVLELVIAARMSARSGAAVAV